jgi:hypothetical protein
MNWDFEKKLIGVRLAQIFFWHLEAEYYILVRTQKYFGPKSTICNNRQKKKPRTSQEHDRILMKKLWYMTSP